MKEINHPLKEKFIRIIEEEKVLIFSSPKDIWSQFESISDQTRRQTYSLIKELQTHGYLEKRYDAEDNVYYSETSKLENFRFDHCKTKALSILDLKLQSINKLYYEKKHEIQYTKELLTETPELDFCLYNYISHIESEIKNIIKKKNNIENIINKIEKYIY